MAAQTVEIAASALAAPTRASSVALRAGGRLDRELEIGEIPAHADGLVQWFFTPCFFPPELRRCTSKITAQAARLSRTVAALALLPTRAFPLLPD